MGSGLEMPLFHCQTGLGLALQGLFLTMDPSIPVILLTPLWRQPRGPPPSLSRRGLPSQCCRVDGNGICGHAPGLSGSGEVQKTAPRSVSILFLSPYLTLLPCSDIYQMEKDIAIEQERNARYRPPKILEPIAFQEPPPKVSQALASPVS